MSYTDQQLIRKIHADLADSHDEELELEFEERSADLVAQAASAADGGDDEQHLRFLGRIHDPLKQWKLSPMDLESRRRWEDYTKAKEIMLERTHIDEAPWWVVQADDKKRARLNCIAHLLSLMPYEATEHEPIVLPERVRHDDYMRRPVANDLVVPEIY